MMRKERKKKLKQRGVLIDEKKRIEKKRNVERFGEVSGLGEKKN